MFQAVLADRILALGTLVHARWADLLLARLAFLQASQAGATMAPPAVGYAFPAMVVLAELTEVHLLVRLDVPALVAGRTVPLLQRDVRAVGVVVRQHRPYEQEEVADPS